MLQITEQLRGAVVRILLESPAGNKFTVAEVNTVINQLEGLQTIEKKEAEPSDKKEEKG